MNFNINTRKILRTSITKIFNERESFHTFSSEKLEVYKNKLENKLVEVKDLDKNYFLEKFDNVELDQTKQNEIDKEMNDSDRYITTISEGQSLIYVFVLKIEIHQVLWGNCCTANISNRWAEPQT